MRAAGFASTLEARREALGILRHLSLSELWDEVLKPFYSARGWEFLEQLGFEPSLDFLLSATAHNEDWMLRIRVVSMPEPVTSGTVLDHLNRNTRNILGPEDGNAAVPLLRCRWILSLILPEEVRREIRERLDEDFGDRVVVWDLPALYQAIVEARLVSTIEPLRLIHAKHQAKRQHDDCNGVFAALWYYRALRFYLRQDPTTVEQAIDCLDAGLAALREDRYRLLHYSRVLEKVLEIWRFLLQSRPAIMGSDLKQSLYSPEVIQLLGHEFPKIPIISWLLQDFEAVFRQMERIVEYHVDGPSGYSTLELCCLLLRFGYSPDEPKIDARLKRGLDELVSENGESVHGKCSLCTGSIVSCFSLARDPTPIEQAVKWLRGLRDQRYCHILPPFRGVEVHHHALHYTAAVLQGFMDFDPEDKLDLLAEALEPFFVSDAREGHKLYREWLLYRNLDAFEIYRKILSTFLRLLLMRKSLPPEQKVFLRTAVADLIVAVKRECRGVQAPFRLHAGRTNLSSFALGCLLGSPGAAELGREVLRTLHYRAQASVQREKDQLWDSIDRTAAFVRGYLDYWEAVLYLVEQGSSVTDFLPVDLGTGTEADAGI